MGHDSSYNEQQRQLIKQVCRYHGKLNIRIIQTEKTPTFVQMSSSLLHNINKTYFWDVDAHTLDETQSKRLIIERVATLGNLKEIKLVIKYYGKEEVIKTLCNLNNLDPKSLSFFSLIFQIPKSNFKCFTKKQSKTQHWTS